MSRIKQLSDGLPTAGSAKPGCGRVEDGWHESYQGAPIANRRQCVDEPGLQPPLRGDFWLSAPDFLRSAGASTSAFRVARTLR